MPTATPSPTNQTTRSTIVPRLALLGLGLLAAACTQTATPAAPVPTAALDPALREKLVGAFSGYEHQVTKEELDRLGSPPLLVAALTSIYQDAEVEPVIRINALASLRFYPLPASRATLEHVLMARETTDAARRSAVKAYGVAFGVEAVPMLDRLLDHPELHTRNAAAGTLAAIPDEKAQHALRRRLPMEKEALVRKTIESGLDR
jgi:hypothetical protein